MGKIKKITILLILTWTYVTSTPAYASEDILDSNKQEIQIKIIDKGNSEITRDGKRYFPSTGEKENTRITNFGITFLLVEIIIIQVIRKKENR